MVTVYRATFGAPFLFLGTASIGRTSPYEATPGDDPVLAVNGRSTPDSGPGYRF